ncbi:MAG: hypothetical protein K2L34_04690, partial [Muribaculaceae bacterium]|nr:hypothetical protein [Muribaculaceae bacterium]
NMDLTIATHSPYILTALNIMMLAKKAKEINDSQFKMLDIAIPLLDPNEVSAWSVSEGQCHSLFNSELGMIDGTYLDQISDEYDEMILNLNDIIYG